MLDTDVYGDATEEEIRALGYDPDDMWGAPSPWELGNKIGEYRKKVAKEKEDATWVIPPAEEGPVVLSEEELAEVYAQMDAEEEKTEEVPAATGEAVAESDDSWQDMSQKNKWEWLDSIETGYNLTNNAFRVAHALAGYGGSNNTKGIFPNHKTLATKTEQSVGNVKKGLTELESKDLIRKVGGGRGHSVHYTIGVPA